MDGSRVGIDEQVAAVEREIKMRHRVYPRWVEAGRMSQAKADQEIRAMEAVLVSLQGLQDPNRLI